MSLIYKYNFKLLVIDELCPQWMRFTKHYQAYAQLYASDKNVYSYFWLCAYTQFWIYTVLYILVPFFTLYTVSKQWIEVVNDRDLLKYDHCKTWWTTDNLADKNCSLFNYHFFVMFCAYQ